MQLQSVGTASKFTQEVPKNVIVTPCSHWVELDTISKVNQCSQCFGTIERIDAEYSDVFDHTPEAKGFYKSAKESLLKHNNASQAIESVLKALEISPNYKKAKGFLQCAEILFQSPTPLFNIELQKPTANKEEVERFKSALKKHLKNGSINENYFYSSEFNRHAVLLRAISNLDLLNNLDVEQRKCFRAVETQAEKFNSEEWYNFLDRLTKATSPKMEPEKKQAEVGQFLNILLNRFEAIEFLTSSSKNEIDYISTAIRVLSDRKELTEIQRTLLCIFKIEVPNYNDKQRELIALKLWRIL